MKQRGSPTPGADLDAIVPAALCRRLVTVPVGIAAALIVGAAAALRWNASLPTACLAGALTLVFATWTRERLEAVFAAALGGGVTGPSILVALVSDVVVGAALGHLLGRLLGADTSRTVLTGAGLSAAWGLVVGQLFCGRAIDDLVLFVLGGGSGRSPPAEPLLRDRPESATPSESRSPMPGGLDPNE